jgi:hypothetical protein
MLMENDQTGKMLKLTQGTLFLNATVWGIFGVLGVFRAVEGGSALRWFLSALMFANAVVMVWFGVKIVSGRNGVFILAILYMALNVVLSITDQFGWIDALILLLNLIVLGLLFVTRQRLQQTGTAAVGDK